jgi:hypothetical protein
MKILQPSRLLYLEKEIQVLTSVTSYLRKEKWLMGISKKDKHPLSDQLVEAVVINDLVKIQTIIIKLKNGIV